jgi:hypothetical protein
MVNDEDIQRIIQEDEPGVGALLEMYGPIEQAYFAAASPSPATVYSTGTATPTTSQEESAE